MAQPIFRFEANVSSEATVNLSVPLPPGTLVEAVVLALEQSEFRDPLDAASIPFDHVQQLEQELKELRDENRCLKRSLAALVFKDEPENLDVKPEDGIFEPSLADLIAELEKTQDDTK